jgi:hypothetical protein
MITKTKTDGVQRSGILQETEFTIKGSAKAFSILSDKLYKDKILAPIRELSTNAYDAHVEAGCKNKPFEVTLPNTLNPTFKIRDFGVGMDEETITSVYTTYFESTKIASNDYVGCLGLGSKSPFAYGTASFTVTSFFNGRKFIYSAFLENGFPKLSKLGEADTDEPNGMQIEFPVDRYDFDSFSSKASDLYRFFKTKPIVKGRDRFEINEADYLQKGDWWALRESSYSYNQYERGCVAVMGNIGYPVDINSIRVCKGITENDVKIAKLILECGIDIQFKIGELDITPSREELSYDDNTIKNIVDKAIKVGNLLKDQIVNEFKSCKTLWDARLKYNEVFNRHSSKYPQNVRTMVREVGIKWKNVDKLSSEVSFKKFWFNKTNLAKMKKDPHFHPNKNFVGSIEKFTRKGESTVGRTQTNVIHAQTDCKTYFVENDLKTGGIGRLRALTLGSDHGDQLYHLKLNDLSKAKRKEFLDKIGINESFITKTSTLPKPPKKARASYARIVKLDENQQKSWNVRDRDFWEADSIDINNGTYYYVQIHRFIPQMDTTESGYTRNFDTGNFKRDILAFLRDVAGINIPCVYGVKTGTIEKIKKVNKKYDTAEWICINDLFIKESKKYIKEQKEYFKALWYRDRQVSDYAGNSLVDSRYDWEEIAKKIKGSKEINALKNARSKIKDYTSNLKTTVPNFELVDDLISITNMDVSKLKKSYKQKSLTELKEDILVKYPILRHIDDCPYSSSKSDFQKDVINYIKFVNKNS